MSYLLFILTSFIVYTLFSMLKSIQHLIWAESFFRLLAFAQRMNFGYEAVITYCEDNHDTYKPFFIKYRIIYAFHSRPNYRNLAIEHERAVSGEFKIRQEELKRRKKDRFKVISGGVDGDHE